jgi:hypothetical protein
MGNERENTVNLLQKLRSTRHRLRVSMGYIDKRAPIALTAAAEPPNLKKEEPLWTLCSDSPTVMTSLRSKALDTGLFTFSFGCAPHALHNLCMDYMKVDSFKTCVSKHVYMVKEIKKTHLLSSMFDSLCEATLGRKYSLILFTRTRWGTALAMLKRMLLLKKVITGMPVAKAYDKKYKEMPLTEDLKKVMQDEIMWSNTEVVVACLTPICAALTHMEGDEATFSCVYATFLFLAHHISQFTEEGQEEMNVDSATLIRRVQFRLKSIFSPAHVLAFITDPFYFGFRNRMRSKHGAGFLELGLGDTTENCRAALKMIARGDHEYERCLKTQFSEFLSIDFDGSTSSLLTDDLRLKPDKAWANFKDNRNLGELANVLVKVHRNPCGAVGGERNHKTNNRVRSDVRIRLSAASCEKQVAVAYNGAQLNRQLEQRRSGDYLWKLYCFGHPQEAEAEDADDEGSDDNNDGYRRDIDDDDDDDGDEVKVIEKSKGHDDEKAQDDEDSVVTEDDFRITDKAGDIMNQYLSDAEWADATAKEADETMKEMPASPTSTIATDRHLARYIRKQWEKERAQEEADQEEADRKAAPKEDVVDDGLFDNDSESKDDLRPAPTKTNIDALPVLVAVQDIPPVAAQRRLKGILDTSEDESVMPKPTPKTTKAKEPIDVEDGGGKPSPVRKPVAKRGRSGSAGGKRTRKPNRKYE